MSCLEKLRDDRHLLLPHTLDHICWRTVSEELETTGKKKPTSFHLVEQIEEGPRLGSVLNTGGVVGDVVDVGERTMIGFLRLKIRISDHFRKSKKGRTR